MRKWKKKQKTLLKIYIGNTWPPLFSPSKEMHPHGKTLYTLLTCVGAGGGCRQPTPTLFFSRVDLNWEGGAAFL